MKLALDAWYDLWENAESDSARGPDRHIPVKRESALSVVRELPGRALHQNLNSMLSFGASGNSAPKVEGRRGERSKSPPPGVG